MRHSSFIILTASLALISGMTWAGPPDQEQSDPPVTESPEMEIEIQVPAQDAFEETAEPIKVLSFEEALVACEDAFDLQSCVDEKTQQPSFESDSETQEMPTSTEIMDTETMGTETMDGEKPACDPALDENCSDFE